MALAFVLLLAGGLTARGQDLAASFGAVPTDDPTHRLVADPEALPAPIVNGLLDHGSPSVGLFLTGGGVCSGTLIGCRTVLTAAHCVCTEANGTVLTGAQCQNRQDLLNPANKILFFQHAGAFGVTSVTVHPDFVFGTRSDLAIVKLAEPVPGVRPSLINQTGRPALGSVGAIVGFGRTGGASQDSGLKRAGLVATGPCAPLPDSTHLCWTFTAPIGAPGSDSNTCQGDSGGPLFMDFGAGTRVTGVTSLGLNPTCLSTDLSADADVFVDRAWIQTVAGTDLHRSNCGSLPFAGEAEAPILAGSNSVTAGSPERRFNFEVPPGVSLLGVTLNGDLGDVDADLFLRRGTAPTPAAFDCASTNGGLPIEVCSVSSPQTGTWHILVRRAAGAGEFQVTATLFKSSGGGGGTAPCVPGEFTLCAIEGRFEITATAPRSVFPGLKGRVSPVFDADLGGAFHYFQADKNFHTVVKIALRPSGFFAVSAVALDPLEWTISIRDTKTGIVKSYTNDEGDLGVPTDVNAFEE